MKSRRSTLFITTLFLSIYTTAAWANSRLVNAMVHFDQVYIPVLAFTSAGDVPAARITYKQLESEWKTFRSKYYNYPANDSAWKKDFNKINDYIISSKNIIAHGKDIIQAHEKLEHVRLIFMQLRQRNGIEYYIDHLTRFHEPMESIVLTVKNKHKNSLTEKDIKHITRTLPEAIRLWQIVINSRLDAKLFGFSQAKRGWFLKTVKGEQAALKNLQRAIKSNDKSRIISTGLAIKPDFAKLFKSFGHFPSPEKKI